MTNPKPGRYHPVNIEEDYRCVPSSEHTGLEQAIKRLEKLKEEHSGVEELSITVTRTNGDYELFLEYVEP